MDINETLNIMNSDFKLWERAATEELGNGRMTKTLTLPWGIGETTVTLEGMNDSGKRRAAVGAFGQHIRSLIDDAINDEAVTSRARQAAAKAEPRDSESGDGVDPSVGLYEGRKGAQEVQEEVVADADCTYGRPVEEPVGFGETLAARRLALEDTIERLEDKLSQARRELRGVTAAIAAMDEESE